MHLLYRIDRGLMQMEKALVIFAFGFLVLSIFFNVVTRNLLGISFHFIHEYTPGVVLWLTLLGSSLAMRSQRHIKIEVLLRYCPPWLKSFSFRITHVFGMGVTGLLLYLSFGFVVNEIAIFGAKGYFSVIFPLFFSIALFRCIIAALHGNDMEPSPMPFVPETK